MWNWTEQTLISQGQGWLRSLAQLTQFRDSRPRVRGTDEPHQTVSLSVICLKSGKVKGEGSGGWSVFSRMGEWCLNTKINLFHFQKHYLFIIFLIFFFFGGGDIGGCPKAEAPRSQLCPGSLAGESPEGPTKAAWPAGSRDGCPWARSRQLLCPDPQGGWTNLGRRSGHREGRCQMCSWVGGEVSWPGAPTPPFLLCFHFYKG